MKRKLLVIEDNPEIRDNTEEILQLAGYDVITAENGKRGVEMAMNQKPNLIICDIMMPELDGYGVLHLLKMKPETAGIPFIFVTAKTKRSDWRKGMEMGADDYITKPFDSIDLLKAVEARLKKQEIVQTQYDAGEKGANELFKEFNVSGFLPLDPEAYDATSLQRRMLLYGEGKRPQYLLKAIFNDMNIAGKFIKLIARDAKEKEDRLLHLAYDSLRKRVAKALTDIHQKFSKEQEISDHIQIPREDIARYVGTATESLIRTLSEFKSERLIEIRDGKIMVLELEKLKTLLF